MVRTRIDHRHYLVPMSKIPLYLLGNEDAYYCMNNLAHTARYCDKNWLCQDIDLLDLGISGNVMDRLQPRITVQAWYVCANKK
jgi:hypothetical protein